MIASGDAQIIPIQLMRAGFVGNPISLGVPEWAGFKADHFETGAREALEKNTACGTDADNCKID